MTPKGKRQPLAIRFGPSLGGHQPRGTQIGVARVASLSVGMVAGPAPRAGPVPRKLLMVDVEARLAVTVQLLHVSGRNRF